VALFSFLLYQVMSDEESSAFVRKVLFGEAVDYNFSIWGKLQFFRTRLFDIVFLIQVACVLKNGIRRIRIYHEQLSGFYSNMEKKELSKINIMLYFFVGISTISVLFSIIGRIPFLKSDWLLLIPSLLFSSLLFAGGMIGFRQDFSVDDFAKDQDRDQKLETVAEGTAIFNESDIRLKTLEENLIALMEDQQLFKQPDLKITDLSVRLGSNRSYVSRIINIQLNTTFSDFVGKYRIEHAKKMLLNFQRSVTMNEIAEQSGFPSESTFYRVFKQEMKISPKAWRQQQMTKCNGGNADEA
jgi:AraC-like DNA-binding protein